MLLKVSLSLCLLCYWIAGSSAGSNVRFPNDEDSDKGGGVTAEERYSDNQASSVVMQPNGVKRLQHYILPQVPSGQNPFGHVNPGGYAEGIILSQPSGRPPPNRHVKPNNKMPEKMKQVQRHPYRVMAKPPPGQLQTRKPLFVPKGGPPPPPKDTRNHPEAMKHKIKHPYFNKEQEFHHLHKPEQVGFSEKELTKLKGSKYYIKGPHPNSETTHPYKFLPTLPPHETHQNFEKIHKEKIHQKDKHIHSTHQHFPSYQPHGEYPQYHEHQNYQEPENLKSPFNKQYIPVQEHLEEPSYLNKKEGFSNYHPQNSHYSDNQKQAQPTVESLADYISKWTSTNKYETKFTPFKEWGDLEEPNFEKAWLSGSEWVPIHAPAPPSIQENLQSYQNFDNSFAGSNNFATYSDTATIANNYPFVNRQYSSQLQYPTQSFSNALSSQASTVSNSFSRPQIEHTINPYDLRAQIFQKPEVVIGKRPKSADINNSHEVSAVFMVKQ